MWGMMLINFYEGVDKVLYVLSFIVAGVFVIGAYRLGIKDGMNVATGRKPDRLIPKKKAEKEQENKLNKGLENILDVRNRHKRGDIGGTKTRD